MTRISDIQSLVCERYGVSRNKLLGDSQSKKVYRARQIGFWLCREITHHSHPTIGRFFNRDHTTVMHGVARIEEMRMADSSFACELDELLALFGPTRFEKEIAATVLERAKAFALAEVERVFAELGCKSQPVENSCRRYPQIVVIQDEAA